MLFILTAPQQTGKTRWLEALVRDLCAHGARCIGVIAPGDWQPRPDGSFEKLGIDNALLPSGERIRFARRRDIAQAEGSYSPTSQSAQAHLLWEISDAAIDAVNAHFVGLMEPPTAEGSAAQPAQPGQPAPAQPAPTLLIVDELGALELKRACGLTEAVRMVERGPVPSAGLRDALIVIRPDLVELAEERFGGIWGETKRIAPDEAGQCAVMSALRLNASH